VARWLQDVAYADVEDAGVADKAVWVVRRTRIRVERFPQFGEEFELVTFCSGMGRMWAERRTTVTRVGAARGEIETAALWVHLDPVRWRPAPFGEEEFELYGASAAGRTVTARLRHPAPDAIETETEWIFRATELDIARHVNNAAYWQPLEQELLEGEAEPAALDVEVEFRNPALAGPKRLLGSGPRRWIVGDAGEVHASFLIAGW
jgi:acyl-ACP thioesterase